MPLAVVLLALGGTSVSIAVTCFEISTPMFCLGSMSSSSDLLLLLLLRLITCWRIKVVCTIGWELGSSLLIEGFGIYMFER